MVDSVGNRKIFQLEKRNIYGNVLYIIDGESSKEDLARITYGFIPLWRIVGPEYKYINKIANVIKNGEKIRLKKRTGNEKSRR